MAGLDRDMFIRAMVASVEEAEALDREILTSGSGVDELSPVW